ncbi:PHB depolymerase family esterase [Candidatus Binatus sp.]|uniref:PHB depolymerase family esterase n=1 Tax=Candidatus Binatus sp. TaxID=2811406 RepID=UPI002F950F05
MKRTICLGVIACLFSCGSATGDSGAPAACGPFGDPSAAVISQVRPNCGAGKLIGPWKDADRIDRYACLYEPKSTGANRKLPMIVYLHPSLFSAGWITQTNILDLQNSVSLTDDPNNVGYIVLAPEGRKTTHYYPFPDNTGVGWDNWYRQLNPTSDVKIGDTTWRENADAAAIDHFIAAEVATGNVDTARIYVSGWSNGAAMGLLYAVNRPNIAAAAVYSGPDPFGAFDDPCRQRPVAGPPANNTQLQIFNPAARTMHVHNSCDIGGICPNGEQLTSELNAAGVVVDDVILDNHRRRVYACTDSCGTDPKAPEKSTAGVTGSVIGFGNHMRWPKEWTTAMLDFFRNHPLKPAP